MASVTRCRRCRKRLGGLFELAPWKAEWRDGVARRSDETGSSWCSGECHLSFPAEEAKREAEKAKREAAQAAAAADALRKQAQAAYDQEQFEDAATLFGQAGDAAREAGLVESPTVCYAKQAGSLIHLERYELALAVSEQAIDLDKALWNGWGARGNALLLLERWDEAADSFQHALDRKPPAKNVADIRKTLKIVKQQVKEQADTTAADMRLTLPAGCDYHFFVSKHEEFAADAELLAQTLRDAGYSVWFSNWEKAEGRSIDKAAMADGIRRSAAVLLQLTPGIFHANRVFITHYELKPAIDSGKAVVCVQHWRFGADVYKKRCHCLGPGERVHLTQTCDGVAEDFQPYARAIINLGIVPWGTDKFMKDEFLLQMAAIYEQRTAHAAGLQKDIATHREFGCCGSRCSFGRARL